MENFIHCFPLSFLSMLQPFSTSFPSVYSISTSSQVLIVFFYCRTLLTVGYIRGIPLSYPYLLAFITFPICAFKNWINVIQMVNAAKALAEVDKDDRQKEADKEAAEALTTPSPTGSTRPKRANAGKQRPISE